MIFNITPFLCLLAQVQKLFLMAVGATHTAMPPPATSHPGSTPPGELIFAFR